MRRLTKYFGLGVRDNRVMAGRVLKAFVFFTIFFVNGKGTLFTHMYIITVTEFESRAWSYLQLALICGLSHSHL